MNSVRKSVTLDRPQAAVYSAPIHVSRWSAHRFAGGDEANIYLSWLQQLSFSGPQVRPSVSRAVRPGWMLKGGPCGDAHEAMRSPLAGGDVIGVDRPRKHQRAEDELAEKRWKNNVGQVQNNESNKLFYRNDKQSSNTHMFQSWLKTGLDWTQHQWYGSWQVTN